MGTVSSLRYFDRLKNLELESSEIDMKVSKQGDGFAVVLKSATLQKSVQLSASSMGSFNENYFDLLPNKEKEIYFYTKETNVTFQLRSLNALQ